MKKRNIMIIVSIISLGSILIIISTYLITVKIPGIENKISNIEKNIEDIYNRRERGILFHSDIKTNRAIMRIDNFERNDIIRSNFSEKDRIIMEERMLNSAVEMIEDYATLFEYRNESNAVFMEFEKKIELIKKESNTDGLEKTREKLENLLSEAKKTTQINLEKLQNNIKELKEKESLLENKRNKWFKIFVWFQI